MIGSYKRAPAVACFFETGFFGLFAKAKTFMLVTLIGCSCIVNASRRLCLILYSVPHLPLGGKFVRTRHERSQLVNINAIADANVAGFSEFYLTKNLM